MLWPGAEKVHLRAPFLSGMLWESRVEFEAQRSRGRLVLAQGPWAARPDSEAAAGTGEITRTSPREGETKPGSPRLRHLPTD